VAVVGVEPRLELGDVVQVGPAGRVALGARVTVAGVIDQAVPRYANAAASVGTYLALAIANRIVDPCSKRGFGDWWATTAGPRWVKLGQAAVDHSHASGHGWTLGEQPPSLRRGSCCAAQAVP